MGWLAGATVAQKLFLVGIVIALLSLVSFIVTLPQELYDSVVTALLYLYMLNEYFPVVTLMRVVMLVFLIRFFLYMFKLVMGVIKITQNSGTPDLDI